MMSESELLSIISQQYPNGIYLDDPNVTRFLSSTSGEVITDAIINRVKRGMFTNSEGCSFTLDIIASEDVIEDIKFNIHTFVLRYSRYQPEAFFDFYRHRINENIIYDAETFQELIKCLLPYEVYSKEMKRLREGPATNKIVSELEGIVEQNGGSIGLDELAAHVPGFTKETMFKCFNRHSASYHIVEDGGYLCVEPRPAVPEDVVEVALEVKEKLQAMDIPCSDEVMNAVLSEKYGKNILAEYGAFSEWIKGRE